MAEPGCVLLVKAVPQAPRSEIVGWLREALKVKVQAPPVDGKANAELCRLLAQHLAVPKAAVTVQTGAGARLKQVHIAGVSLADARARLGAAARG